MDKTPKEQPKTVGTSAKEGQIQTGGNEARFSGSRCEARQVICPACGQIQSAERKKCWNCEVRFIFDGEE